jgi:hypothetical protein
MARRTLEASVKEGILRDLAAGVSPAVVAKTYGISIPTAYNYRNRAVVAAVAPEVVAETVTTTRKTSR